MQTHRETVVKATLASVLALLGLIAGGRMLWVHNENSSVKPVSREVLPAVQAVLAGDYDTYPTARSVEEDIQTAIDRASGLIAVVKPSLKSQQQIDLAQAFGERLAAVIAPDYQRDQSARESRGKPVESIDQINMRSRQQSESINLYDKLPMNIQELEVRFIYINGKLVVPLATREGFGVLTTRVTDPSLAFPMHDYDPESHRLDVIEVRLPMEMPVPPPGSGLKERFLAAFQFVWSKERSQWIPWQNVLYGNPNSPSYGLPF